MVVLAATCSEVVLARSSSFFLSKMRTATILWACGYVEHVAVDDNTKDYPFLNWQQQVLIDPLLQQVLAEDCHLHWSTEATIREVFDDNNIVLSSERLVVPDML